jgi:hypothetical protein
MKNEALNATSSQADDPLTVNLSKPITVIGQTVSQLTLVPPLGFQLMKAGATLRIITATGSDEVSVEINPAAMGKMISACFNIPFRTVEDLPAVDFMACSSKLMPFLVPATS